MGIFISCYVSSYMKFMLCNVLWKVALNKLNAHLILSKHVFTNPIIMQCTRFFFLSFPKYGKQALGFPHLHSNMDLQAKGDLCTEVI